ncbi:hypothetical protein M2G36_21125 [Vibrio vulnificus]|nr:hypothetical protein [Vibrio vulnificus]MCG9655944.1 hypothetical protein [Vibrio vulnificus]MCU8141964.1 hypothetical protein [Vibrio vulnificus]MCU8181719.1 hypothetical protein [Vibrio vulnificus]MCU8225600.1 hypothetical protein [Vibrio vulnificus]
MVCGNLVYAAFTP